MANGTWRIARGRGSARLPLAIFAVLAVALLLVGRAQPALFNKARATVSDWSSPALEALRIPVNAVGEWAGGLGNILAVFQENMRLKEQNARLRQWQNAALMLEQRLERYRQLLHAVPDPAVGSVTAHVIGRANRPFLDTMILDAGKRQGIKPGEAVVDARGMIGRIYLAGDHTSWVILLTDLNSRIPVAIQPGNVQALLAGDNSASPALESSTPGAKLKTADRIVTSGDGALLPADLPVGVVRWDGGAYRAALFADSGTSDDVRILDLKAAPEQPPEPSRGDLPVTAAGLAPLAPPSHALPATGGSAVAPPPAAPSLRTSFGALKASPDRVVTPVPAHAAVPKPDVQAGEDDR